MACVRSVYCDYAMTAFAPASALAHPSVLRAERVWAAGSGAQEAWEEAKEWAVALVVAA